MNDTQPQARTTRHDMPREPMPKSLRPAWIYIGLMALVTVVIGIASAVVAILVQ
jgi:hypothetical protein